MATPGVIGLVEELFRLERAGQAGAQAGLDHAAFVLERSRPFMPGTTASWSGTEDAAGPGSVTARQPYDGEAASARQTAGLLEATFTASAISVTADLEMVELILSGTGTGEGFGAATDVTGVVEDHVASPCGAGGAADSAVKRIVMSRGVLELHEAGMVCTTASGPQVTATYQVDVRASTGIFAGARGTGNVTVDVTSGHEALSGTLILAPPPA